MSTVVQHPSAHNDPHWDLRVDLAATFRWTVRERWHEAVSNHSQERIERITVLIHLVAFFHFDAEEDRSFSVGERETQWRIYFRF